MLQLCTASIQKVLSLQYIYWECHGDEGAAVRINEWTCAGVPFVIHICTKLLLVFQTSDQTINWQTQQTAIRNNLIKMIPEDLLSLSDGELDVPPRLKKPQAYNCSCLFSMDISLKTPKNNFSFSACCVLYGRIIIVWRMMRIISIIVVRWVLSDPVVT
jgi:hypothetical protein